MRGSALAFWVLTAGIGYLIEHELDGAIFGLVLGIGISFVVTVFSAVIDGNRGQF